jgi:alpha-tubulin suppressor-like RCC1 family protein
VTVVAGARGTGDAGAGAGTGAGWATVRRPLRRLAGLVAVGVVLCAAVVAGTRTREAPGTALDTVAETAWLPGPAPGTVMLADALTARAVTVVPAGDAGDADDPMTVTQAGGSAVVLTRFSATVIHAATWRPTQHPPNLDPFVAAGASAVWLLSPHTDTARRVDLEAAAAGRPDDDVVVVGEGLTPRDVRVTDDGTLWVLGPHDLRSFPPGRPPGAVPLGPDTPPRALTLVDSEPVVVEAHRARHVDSARTAFDREWPMALPEGPITAAERSTAVVVARVGDHLGVGGSGRAPSTIEPEGAGDGAPVEHGGLVYLADRASPGILVFDPRRPGGRPAHRIGLPPAGAVSLFAHHRRVWYVQRGPAGGGTRAGVLTPSFTARRIAGPGAGDGDGPGGGTADAGPADDAPPTPPEPIGLDPEAGAGACARSWTPARCLTDGGPEPATRPAADTMDIACPRPWPVTACAPGPGGATSGPAAPGVPAAPGPGDPVAPVVPGVAAALDVPGSPPPPGAGGADPGRPPVADDVDGGAGTIRLPPIIGHPLAEAKEMLHAASLSVRRAEPHPSFDPPDTVFAVHHNLDTLANGAPVQTDWALDLDISDGSRPVKMVAPAMQNTCVVLIGGAVSCRGSNGEGELGNGGWGDTLEPTAVIGLGPGTPLGPATSVTFAVVGSHTCALLADRTAACWGFNWNGQLGDGHTRTSSYAPVKVLGLRDIDQLGAGGSFTCARARGRVWCWGWNRPGVGQLGRQSAEDAPEPGPVEGTDGALRIAVGYEHACALLADHTVKCWGSNQYGQIGDGPPADGSFPPEGRPTPVPVVGLEGQRVRDIVAGEHHTCALLESGSVSCWGGDFFSSADGSAASSTPTTVPGLARVEQIVAGDQHACALVTGGQVRCWGNPGAGVRGDGTSATTATEPRSVPTTMVGLPPVTEIYAGGSQTCAVLADRSLYCTGIINPSDPALYGSGGGVKADGWRGKVNAVVLTPTRIKY